MNLKGAIFHEFHKFVRNSQNFVPARNIALIDRETYLYYIQKISQDNIDMRTYYSIKIVFRLSF